MEAKNKAILKKDSDDAAWKSSKYNGWEKSRKEQNPVGGYRGK